MITALAHLAREVKNLESAIEVATATGVEEIIIQAYLHYIRAKAGFDSKYDEFTWYIDDLLNDIEIT